MNLRMYKKRVVNETYFQGKYFLTKKKESKIIFFFKNNINKIKVVNLENKDYFKSKSLNIKNYVSFNK